MLHLFLSPNGAISSSQMLKGGFVLIALGTVMNLSPIVPALAGAGSLLFWLGFVLIFPWVFLWMKRYRDGGQHPAMSVIPIIVFALILTVVFIMMNWGFITEAFAIGMDAEGDQAAANEAMADIMTEEYIGHMSMALVFAPLIAALITLFGLNALIRHKPASVTDETFD